MGYHTSKAMVMFRPRDDMEVLKDFPGDDVPRICPATVCDKVHVGYMIKYWLQIDDGAVRCFIDLLLVTAFSPVISMRRRAVLGLAVS